MDPTLKLKCAMKAMFHEEISSSNKEYYLISNNLRISTKVFELVYSLFQVGDLARLFGENGRDTVFEKNVVGLKGACLLAKFSHIGRC